MTFNFIQRKCDVEREKRVNAILSKGVKTNHALNILNKELHEIQVRHSMENYVINRINNDIDVEVDTDQKGRKVFKMKVKYIDIVNEKYSVCDGVLIVQMVGENYVETWRNIGADYHTIHLKQSARGIDYWYTKNMEFLLEQLNNQDNLQDICDDMDILKANYIA